MFILHYILFKTCIMDYQTFTSQDSVIYLYTDDGAGANNSIWT